MHGITASRAFSMRVAMEAGTCAPAAGGMENCMGMGHLGRSQAHRRWPIKPSRRGGCGTTGRKSWTTVSASTPVAGRTLQASGRDASPGRRGSKQPAPVVAAGRSDANGACQRQRQRGAAATCRRAQIAGQAGIQLLGAQGNQVVTGRMVVAIKSMVGVPCTSGMQMAVPLARPRALARELLPAAPLARQPLHCIADRIVRCDRPRWRSASMAMDWTEDLQQHARATIDRQRQDQGPDDEQCGQVAREADRTFEHGWAQHGQ